MKKSYELEFSKDGYRKLLNQIKEKNYIFKKMHEFHILSDKQIILRHDVDFCVDYALEMAEIEYQNCIIANYFFMLTSDFYNIFSPSNRKKLKEIRKMGHQIGLHWDSKFIPVDKNKYENFFKSQLTLLSEAVEDNVRSASQHIPTDSTNIDFEKYIDVEAYSKKINSFYYYVSDSSMTWRKLTPLDCINQGKSFQFLAHPIWWIAPGKTQDEKINSLISTISNEDKNIARSYLKYMRRILQSRETYDNKFKSRIKN